MCIFFVCWQVQVKFFSVPCLTNENRRQYEKNEKNTIRTNHNRRQYERTTIDGNTNDRQTAIRKNDELQYKQTMQDDDLTCDSPIQNVQNLCDGHDQKMSVSESPIRRPEIYKPQFLIGQGTYGSVAVSSFDKNIVVKTSEPSFAFYNEVATFHQLKGVPGIPKYHGFSLKDGCAQLFLERYPLCLTAFLNQVANPACFLPSIVRQLTLIVAACHVRGVVHSDISLNNILVRPLYNTNNSSAAAANHHPKPGLTISTASASSRQHMPNEDDKKEDNSSTNLLSKSFDNNNAIVDVEIALCDFGCSHMFVFGKDIVSMAQYVTTAPWRAPEISEQEKSPELRFTPKIDVFSMGMIFCDILFWKSLSMQIINKRNCKDDTKMVLQEIKNPTRKVDPNLALFLPCLLESNPKKRITAGHLLFDSHFQRYCGLKVDFLVFPMSPNGDPFNKNNKNLDGLRNIAEKLCESVFNECGLSFLEKHTRNLIKTQACSIIWKYEHRKTIDPQVLIVFVCCACVLACSHQCIQPSLDRINRLFFPYLSLSILQSVMDDLFCTTEGNIFS